MVSFRFIIIGCTVWSIPFFSAHANLQDLPSQNIVGYVTHVERSRTVVLNMRDVGSFEEGFRLSQVTSQSGIMGENIPGTQACFFDGDDWVHVEQFLCNGELHWCKWIDEKTAILADDLLVPFGVPFSYAIPKGVSSLQFTGEFIEVESFQPKLDFVDEKTYIEIRKALQDIASYKPVVVEAIMPVPESKSEELCVPSEIITNYVTHYITNYVEVSQNRFLVKLSSGEFFPAIYSIKLNRACNPETGYPLDFDINKAVFMVDLTIDEYKRADEALCLRYYDYQRWGGVRPINNPPVAAEAASSFVWSNIGGWLFNKILDNIWIFIISGGGIVLLIKKIREKVVLCLRYIKEKLRR